ncbi:hypothetical protein F5146DRAFT_1176589 [Armillaria mellea]|nr:hypothetical protein F5146DRAFT_1176589 [Armillaria mellea]
MAAGYSGIPIPELTDSEINDILADLDLDVNDTILNALLYGIYTGVVAVTLWAVASGNKSENRKRPRFLIAGILALYLLTGYNLYRGWVGCLENFTTLAWKSVWEIFYFISSPTPIVVVADVTAILSAVLADAILIWRCWIVWSRSWLVVIVPIACTTLSIASRGIVAYYNSFGPLASPQTIYLEKVVNWAMLYSSLIMATLLWCTILIIYRIVRVGGAAGRIHIYQRVIEMLVESAALYSAMIVVLLVFEARNALTANYIQNFTIAMRGIMPTMIVGRVAAGHARPDDSWSESSPRSTIRFRNSSTSQNDTEMSLRSGQDTFSPGRPELEEGLKVDTEAHRIL